MAPNIALVPAFSKNPLPVATLTTPLTPTPMAAPTAAPAATPATTAPVAPTGTTVTPQLQQVQTGEVMLNTMVSKTILSAGVSRDIFRFIEMGTELVEIETGYSQNEAMGYATRSTIEEAVYSLIQQGLKQQLWDFKYEKIN